MYIIHFTYNSLRPGLTQNPKWWHIKNRESSNMKNDCNLLIDEKNRNVIR